LIKGRGPITFFAHIDTWGRIDRFIKADIIGCFDNIDHSLLNGKIGLDLGESNEDFCNLIAAFLKTSIRDKDGKVYGSCVKGIPQGSPLSPVLMNIYLHQLDMKIQAFLSQEEKLRYVRYADDMAFAIKEGGPTQIQSACGFSNSFTRP